MKHTIRLFIGIVLFSNLFIFVYASAPMVQTQVPGFYRTHVGKFEVSALSDGTSELDAKLLKNIQTEKLKHSLSDMFVQYPNMQTAVNAYLVNTGDHLVLIDAGAGNLLGQALGRILDNLKAAGYTAEQVDTVLLTHLHADHAGGLIDTNGHPVFPKAEVLVAKKENSYWLSKQTSANASSELKPFFEMVSHIAEPYIANEKWATFTANSVVVPGIKAVSIVGHTPGHTAYEIESDGKKLLVWGDIVHSHAVQFDKPSVAFAFDADATEAISTRLKLMQSLATSRSLVAGAHLPFPGIGHINAKGNETFQWVPVEFH